MNRLMSGRYLPPPSDTPSGGGLERLLARIMGWLVWAGLALLGLVFLASLLVWLVVMVVFSLVSSWVTGRPATVTLLWQRYRDLARRRWPQRPADPDSSTPRADAAQATGASRDTGVSDVRWRDIPAARDDAGDAGPDPRG